MPAEVALDRTHDVGRPDRGEDVEGVLGARQLGVHNRLLRNLPQLLDEQPGLRDRDEGVVHAVQHEEVGSVRCHPQDGGGSLEVLSRLVPGLLEDPRREERVAEQLRAAQARDPGEVVDAVVRHRGLDGGVGVLETGLVGRVVGGERGQSSQVATSRTSGDRDVVGVPAVGGDVLPDPGDRLLDVDDVRREGVTRREPVVDRDADPAPGGHVLHQRDALLVLGADRPATSVHLQQDRCTREIGLVRQVEVEQPATAGVAVAEVLLHAYADLAHPERVDQLAPRRGQVVRAGCGVELLHVVDAQTLDQGVLGVVLDLAALRDEVGRAGRRAPATASPTGSRRRPLRAFAVASAAVRASR